jgi:hypothetical protein
MLYHPLIPLAFSTGRRREKVEEKGSGLSLEKVVFERSVYGPSANS